MSEHQFSSDVIDQFNQLNIQKYGNNEFDPSVFSKTNSPIKPRTPFIPAISNFQTAKKMHQENLEHQPLPDAVMDIAFRKAQVAGSLNPGASLEVGPYATGIISNNLKDNKSGVTKCQKTFFHFFLGPFLEVLGPI